MTDANGHRYEPLEAALDHCLAQIRAGQELDACLRTYPNIAAELRPLLEMALAIASVRSREPVPAPPNGLASARAALFGHTDMRAAVLPVNGRLRGLLLRPALTPLAAGVRLRLGARQLWWGLAAAVAVLVFFFGSANLLSDVVAEALPGQPLYTVKRMSEVARLAVTFDQHARDRLMRQYSARRWDEARRARTSGLSGQIDDLIGVAVSYDDDEHMLRISRPGIDGAMEFLDIYRIVDGPGVTVILAPEEFSWDNVAGWDVIVSAIVRDERLWATKIQFGPGRIVLPQVTPTATVEIEATSTKPAPPTVTVVPATRTLAPSLTPSATPSGTPTEPPPPPPTSTVGPVGTVLRLRVTVLAMTGDVWTVRTDGGQDLTIDVSQARRQGDVLADVQPGWTGSMDVQPYSDGTYRLVSMRAEPPACRRNSIAGRVTGYQPDAWLSVDGDVYPLGPGTRLQGTPAPGVYVHAEYDSCDSQRTLLLVRVNPGHNIVQGQILSVSSERLQIMTLQGDTLEAYMDADTQVYPAGTQLAVGQIVQVEYVERAGGGHLALSINVIVSY